MKRHRTIASVGLALLVVTSVLPAGLVGTGSAMPPDADVYTISQGGDCWEVEPWEPGDTNPETGDPIRPHVKVIESSEEGGDFENDSWDESPTIESIMDYRYRDPAGGVHENPNAWGQRPRYSPWLAEYYLKDPWSYGTYGLWNWSANQESRLFLFGGPEGDSVVVRHDKLYDNTGIGSHNPYNGMYGEGDGFMSEQLGGGAATFIFRNLPRGEWAYLDDLYPENMDSIYYASGEFQYDAGRHTRFGTYHNNYGAEPLETYEGNSNFTAHWTWGSNGTDGGAYRGLDNLDSGESITIEPHFNDEAYFWYRKDPSEDTVTDWVVRRKNGESIDLDMDRPVKITRGSYCLEGELEADRSTVEAGQSVTFTADSGASEYRWDFDDGTNETTSDPQITHTFESAGDWDVTVTMVSDDRTASASATVDVLAGEPPTADFTVDDDAGDPEHVVAGETVTLNGSASSDNVALADSYEWNVSGSAESGERVSHAFGSPGEYRVELTVEDETGRNDTVAKRVTVLAEDDPDAEARPDPARGEAGAPIAFDGSQSSDGNGSVETYEWSAPDGSVDQGDTSTPGANVTFDSAGEYRVNLTVTDNNGNSDTDSAAVNVTPASDPVIEGADVPSEVSVDGSFDVSADVRDDSRLTYAWSFRQNGATETRSGPTPSYSFDEVGEAAVRLEVRDAGGRTNGTDWLAVDVTGKPSAALSVSGETRVGESVTLDASDSSDAIGEITEYRWDFEGDGEIDTAGTDPTVTHEYGSSGSYDPAVTVVDDDGNTDTASASVTIQEEKALDGGGGGGGGSAGGGGGTSLGPPPVVTETERAGPNGAVVDVRNARSDETVAADLPAANATEGTGVDFERVAFDLRDDDSHVAFESAASAAAPDGAARLGAPDRTLAYLDLGASYLDAEVANATVEFTVERTALGPLASGNDVAVYRYDAGWERVDATVAEATGERYRMKATAPGLGTLAVGANRPVSVAEVGLASETVATGDPVEATATVENAGTAARSPTVNLTLDGTSVASETVEVAPGESTDVTLSGPAPAAGTYEVEVGGAAAGNLTVEETLPANTSVTDVSLNASAIATGERVEITATVENDGGEPGERAVTLTMFGNSVATKNVTVPAGETAEVTFVRQVNAEGNYTVDVEGRTASLSVTGADDGVLGPDAPDVPGFGVGAALVALLAATLLARLRD